MRTHKQFPDIDWALATNDKGQIADWHMVKVAVLMDIREELRTLNRLLACPNFIQIPATLRSISRKLPAKRRRATKAA